jgi:hypothetical protein
MQIKKKLIISIWNTPAQKGKGKAPTFSLDNRLTDGGEVASLTRRQSFILPGSFLVLISVTG